jgi:hypothetical protein
MLQIKYNLEKMNKKYFSILFSILCFFCSCNPAEGLPAMSNTIQESQERGVFICEYEPLRNPIIINDTIRIEVDRCWLEKHWIYPKNPAKTIVRNGYQMIFFSKNEIGNGYPFNWTIGIDFKRNFRSCGQKCLMTDFDTIPNSYEEWDVQLGNDLFEKGRHLLIGKVKLIRR